MKKLISITTLSLATFISCNSYNSNKMLPKSNYKYQKIILSYILSEEKMDDYKIVVPKTSNEEDIQNFNKKIIEKKNKKLNKKRKQNNLKYKNKKYQNKNRDKKRKIYKKTRNRIQIYRM